MAHKYSQYNCRRNCTPCEALCNCGEAPTDWLVETPLGSFTVPFSGYGTDPDTCEWVLTPITYTCNGTTYTDGEIKLVISEGRLTVSVYRRTGVSTTAGPAFVWEREFDAASFDCGTSYTLIGEAALDCDACDSGGFPEYWDVTILGTTHRLLWEAGNGCPGGLCCCTWHVIMEDETIDCGTANQIELTICNDPSTDGYIVVHLYNNSTLSRRWLLTGISSGSDPVDCTVARTLPDDTPLGALCYPGSGTISATPGPATSDPYGGLDACPGHDYTSEITVTPTGTCCRCDCPGEGSSGDPGDPGDPPYDCICCDQGDAPYQFDLDLGAGGWVDHDVTVGGETLKLCDRCADISGVFTLTLRTIEFGGSTSCYWLYDEPRWCQTEWHAGCGCNPPLWWSRLYIVLWRTAAVPGPCTPGLAPFFGSCYWHLGVYIFPVKRDADGSTCVGTLGRVCRWNGTTGAVYSWPSNGTLCEPSNMSCSLDVTLIKYWEGSGEPVGAICEVGGGLPATVHINPV